MSLAGGNTGSESLKGFALSATAVQVWRVSVAQAKPPIRAGSECQPPGLPHVGHDQTSGRDVEDVTARTDELDATVHPEVQLTLI
jgi:hypothetical protein